MVRSAGTILDGKKKNSKSSFNQLTTNVSHHIETSQIICIGNHLIGFYMIEIISRL